jgi:large conductance mechanosensitive channel
VSLLQDFKTFLMRGNLVDLAVAFVMGAVFAALLKSFIGDLITPIIALVFGQPDFSALSFTINGSHFLYGDFLNALFTFLTTAAVIFFFVVRPYNALMARRSKEDPTTKPCPECTSAVPLAARRCPFCTAQIGEAATAEGRRAAFYKLNAAVGLGDRDDPAAAAGGELHGAGRPGVDRVVLADPDALTGLEAGTALADDDLPAGDGLPGEHLDAEHVGVGVAAVAAGSQTFLMRHRLPPQSLAPQMGRTRPSPWTGCGPSPASSR